MTGLQQQTISINLGTGINTNEDTKASSPQTYKQIKNCFLDKQKRLDKRFGTDKLSTTVQTDYTKSTPLTIGSSSIKSQLIEHDNQLLLQNKGALYSYLEAQNKWQFKGHYYPVDVKSEIAQSNEYFIENPNCGYLSGYKIIAYRVSVGSINQVRVSLIEDATGNYIAEDSVVAANSTGEAINYIRVITFSSKVFITWQQANTIKLCEINILTGALGSTTNLKTDAKAFTGINDASFEVAYTNKAGVGERTFFAYSTTGNFLYIFSIDNTGTIDATMGNYTVALTIKRGYSIFYNSAGDYLSIAYQENNNIVAKTFSFTSSAITLSTTSTLLSQSSTIPSIAFFGIVQCEDPATSSQTNLFFDQNLVWSFVDSSSSLKNIGQNICYRAVITKTTVVTSAYIIGKGLNIYAKPIVDTSRATIYLPMFYYSELQGSCIVVDILKGKNEQAHYVLAKWNYGTADRQTDFTFSSIPLISTGKYMFAHEIKTRITKVTTGSISGGGGGTTTFGTAQAFVTSANLSIINLFPEYAASNANLCNTTLFSGGYLAAYDSAQFNEHGFFADAENFQLVHPTTNARIQIDIQQQGTGGLPEITLFTFFPAQLQLSGAVGTNYWTFTTTTTTVNVYYIINGVGVDPAVAGFNVGVTLTGNESGYEVARKTAIALDGLGLSFTVSAFENNTITITNSANGVVTDASSANYQSAATGASVGTRSYTTVFYAIDANGQILRSRVATEQSITTTSTRPTCITVSAPPITNRNVAQLKCEIYRTVDSGTILRKLTSYTTDLTFNLNDVTVCYLDTTTDALLGDEQLYTTGGVLNNYSMPACRSVSTFKNRITAVSSDLNVIQYSKSALLGAPVEMAEENQIAVSFDDKEIIGTKQLDDKLIIGKKNSLFYMAGDGSNDLGQNTSFSQPAMIASDVGFLNQNSLEVYDLGLVFNSNQGIYLLSRSLQAARIGQPADDFKSNLVGKSLLSKTNNQLRFVFQDITQALVYNYEDNFWHQFQPYGGDDACLWQGQFSRVDSSGNVYVENTTKWIDDGSVVESYTQFVETHWLKIKNMQDYQRIYRAGFLGELKTACTAVVKVYVDYDETSFDTYTFVSSLLSPSIVYQFIMHIKKQKCESIKLSIEITPTGSNTEQGVTLTDMSFLVGIKQGLAKLAKARNI